MKCYGIACHCSKRTPPPPPQWASLQQFIAHQWTKEPTFKKKNLLEFQAHEKIDACFIWEPKNLAITILWITWMTIYKQIL